MAVIIADKHGRSDGSALDMMRTANSRYNILMISRVDDYEFNEGVLSFKGEPYILCDFTELGWDHHWRFGHHWGVNTNEFDFLKGDEIKKLDDFISENPPILTFCRELLKSDVKENVLPIEYPCRNEIPPIQSKDKFNKRPISVFNFWGRSNEQRLVLHGKIWQLATTNNLAVCDNIYYINNFLNEEKQEKWCTFWIPHYQRVPIENILQINGLSKLSVSMPGAGVKCFRSTGESPISSVLVQQKDNLAWSYEWTKDNCILAEPGKECEAMVGALKNPDLYEVYLAGVENCRNYWLPNYISYIEKTINQYV